MSELPSEPAAVPPDERSSTLRIFTWNINGIRSLDDFQERLQKTEADIICVQETKVIVLWRDVTLSISRVQVTRDMLTEAVALIPGFTSYFAFSRLKSGYSGVATFCRTAATPVQVQCLQCWNVFDENL